MDSTNTLRLERVQCEIQECDLITDEKLSNYVPEPSLGIAKNDIPRVSCLMVTGDRKFLSRRAIQCFINQTYQNKELVIVDDGEEDYTDLLSRIPKDEYKYIKIKKCPNTVLGSLRNLTLDAASGDYLVQWDDDDWYHPDRIKIQATYLDKGYDACSLSATLVHICDETSVNMPFIGTLKNGVPGSIMHRNDRHIRYPALRKGEDTIYQKEWMSRNFIKLSDEYNHLFIRCYHGKNTWNDQHFYRRMRNGVKDFIIYCWYKFVIGDLKKNPKFVLKELEQSAYEQYIKDSKSLNLIKC
jgi:glycosyltransferase involved in cell wall biosynthesis